jgi:hypothetical protein
MRLALYPAQLDLQSGVLLAPWPGFLPRKGALGPHSATRPPSCRCPWCGRSVKMTAYWCLCIKIVMVLGDNVSAQAPVAGNTNSANRWSANSSLSKFSLGMLIWKITVVNFMKNVYFEGQCLLWRPAVFILLKNVYLEVHLLSFSWKILILKVSGRNFHEECLLGSSYFYGMHPVVYLLVNGISRSVNTTFYQQWVQIVPLQKTNTTTTTGNCVYIRNSRWAIPPQVLRFSG